ncbi:MAG: FAD-binding protein [Candidatus Limnocylindria bacterium]
MISDSPAALATLRERLTGRLIQPDDTDYDALRVVVAGDIDHRPVAIARTRSTDDVVAVVNFARDHDVELAVRCGGHSGPGYGTVEGGIVLDPTNLFRRNQNVPPRP